MFREESVDRRRERGQSVVEMAVLVPMLMVLLMGIVDLGRAFHDYVVLSNAVREGARYGSRYAWYTTGIVDAVRTDATSNGLSAGAISVSVAFPEGFIAMRPIRVTGRYAFDTILGSLVGVTTVTLQSITEMSVFATAP